MALKSIAALSALAFVASAWAQIDPNKTMIVVNGQSIKAGEYYSRMENLPDVGRLVGATFVPASPGFLTLQQLINERLMVELAKEKKVYPSDKQLQDELAFRKRKYPSLQEAFAEMGVSEHDYNYGVMVQLCEFNLRTMGVTVTDFEIDNYYRAHLNSTYTVPLRYSLRVIIVANQADTKPVDQALAGGMSFADAAAKYSVEVSKLTGGSIGDIAETSLREAVKDNVIKTKKGEMTPWFKQGDTWMRFLVEDIKPKKVIPLDADLKAEIRRELMLNGGSSVNKVNEWMADMRKKAKFEFQNTAFDEEIKQAFGKGAGS